MNFSILVQGLKKRILFLSLIIIGGVITPSLCFAASWSWWYDIPLKIAIFLVGSVFGILALVFSSFFSLSVIISQWVMNISTKIPITTGWAYDYGWILVRDLANIIFIIMLSIIGIATILRIKEYQFQKTLPALIIVALLINFSPIVVGLVVDIFNVLTNFFLDSSAFGKAFSPITTMLTDYSRQMFSSIVSSEVSIAEFAGTVFGLAAVGGYFLFGSFVFLIIALIFMLRVIAFWVLLILAPLAFISYVLPKTRNLFQMWWTQLIQWGIIGFTTAFFIYLSSHLLANTNKFLKIEDLGDSLSGFDYGIVQLITRILPYVIALVFLLIGIILGLSTGAMGASQVINWSKRTGKTAIKKGGTATLGAIRGVPKIAEAEKRVRRRAERIPVIGRAFGGPGGHSAELAKRRGKAEEELKGRSPDEIRAKIDSPALTDTDRLARAKGLEKLAEQGSLKEGDKKHLADAKRYGANLGSITGKMPQWADIEGKSVKEKMDKIKANKAREIQAEAFKNDEVVKALRLDQTKDLDKAGSPEQKQNTIDTIRRILPGVSAGPGSAFHIPTRNAPPFIGGIDTNIIRHIAQQQRAGVWPK
ncbi:MAG: hypothetical protein ABH800_00555 [Candidatus Nealsonbacteria bacterium]